ncbi:MAG: hypothetical protein HXX08_14565 [Chloroflexi bacterium]|uniref:TraD/TraG TraM recognition site domain-containing protein n=1 Tax=Candidatus Chlorohelix allophototropha TaxID=3003348 RepID=A0A8T7M4R0_9CHLR|nr:hypothetical protein [Chloroflexota bacterium]WJW70393.1 hypothetical protein OZ401_004969 [Chloroflexota bacterium L227-S17]
MNVLKADSFLAEPGLFLGYVRVAGAKKPFSLPLESALNHTLITSRSGGGKSHTLAVWCLGLAKIAAIRRRNLRLATISNSNHQTHSADNAYSPVKSVPTTPPISLCLFDPHRSLARRTLEDIARLVASVRVSRWLGATRESGINPQRLAALSPTEIQPVSTQLLQTSRPSEGWWEELLEEMVVYLNLGDRLQPFGLNLLDTAMWDSKETCAATTIAIMKRLFPDSWGVRLEDLLRNALFALFLLNTCRLTQHQFTLLDVVPLITIDPLREALLELPVIREDNPALYAWWKIQFTQKMDERFRNEVIKPVLNKINPFLTSDLLSHLLGQPTTTLDFAPLISSGGIVLVDLAAAELEVENAALAGAVLIGFLLRQARQGASAIPEEEERPVVQLVVDEFSSMPAVPYGRIFAEDRKFGVRALLATQSLRALDKLDPLLRPLVLANQANLLALQVNAEDAEYLRGELVADSTGGGVKSLQGGLINPAAGGGVSGPDLYDLVNAPQGLCYAKLTVGKRRQPVCSIQVAPRFSIPDSLKAVGLEKLVEMESREIEAGVLERSRLTHSRPVGEVADYLRRKELEYLGIFELKLPDPDSSVLFCGFGAEIKGQLFQELHFWLKAEGKRRQEYTARRAYRASGSTARPPKIPESQAATEKGDRKDGTGQAATKANIGEEVKLSGPKEKGVKPEKPLLPLPEPLPAIGVDWKVPPPVRSQGTPAEDLEKGLNWQDGRDYRPETQVKQQRQALLAAQRRKAREVLAAREAREQGLRLGEQALRQKQAEAAKPFSPEKVVGHQEENREPGSAPTRKEPIDEPGEEGADDTPSEKG